MTKEKLIKSAESIKSDEIAIRVLPSLIIRHDKRTTMDPVMLSELAYKFADEMIKAKGRMRSRYARPNEQKAATGT